VDGGLSPGPGTPLRVAGVDIGSNAIRLRALEIAAAGRTVLERHRAAVRLGRAAFRDGVLDPAAMRAAIAALRAFRRRLDELGIRDHRVVATSAVRDSRNGRELIVRARRASGLEVEPIDAAEEARLVWLAVRDRVPLAGRRLLADLGGGSLELAVAEGDALLAVESHPVGTVRMLDELDADPARPDDMASPASDAADPLARPVSRLEARLAARLDGLRLPAAAGGRTDGVVGTGGNIQALSRLAGAARSAGGGRRLRVADLRAVAERLGALTYDQRVLELGLRPDRADVIMPAALVFLRVAALAEADEILVPRVGVVDGLLLDLARGQAARGFAATPAERRAHDAALALGRRFDFHEPHARQVARLAVSFFDQLRGLHGLGDADRRVLLGAALLHDIGQSVEYRNHHKHSLELILRSRLPAFADGETPLVALVARYHRGATPRDDHPVWAGLGASDRRRVVRMAGLLRLADALDRDHAQAVRSARAAPRDGALVLELALADGARPDLTAVGKKAGMLEAELGVMVAVSFG
jgi:exopolyphosphatase / guanosine-5'-triphosphate,3'-diphosphate pyrophosphatase